MIGFRAAAGLMLLALPQLAAGDCRDLLRLKIAGT